MDLFLSFNGRINRAKWWLGSIAVFVVLVVLMMVLMFAVGGSMTVGPDGQLQGGGTMSIISIIVYLAALWPSLALQVKRWHDRDKSGWWVLINLVPFIGGIWALIECGFLEGTKGPNKFGPDPLAQTATA
jgi:uncharacterized membrane protein YhaH (DUF805 family)